MTDREKLIELIQTAVNGCASYWAGLIADLLIAHGVTFATDNHVGGKWIPVTERLPDVNKSKAGYESVGVIVLIEGRKKSAYRTYERAINRGKIVYRWKYPWDRISDENITHWMPLPEMPKEGE